jgi:immune inhibitor A
VNRSKIAPLGIIAAILLTLACCVGLFTLGGAWIYLTTNPQINTPPQTTLAVQSTTIIQPTSVIPSATAPLPTQQAAHLSVENKPVAVYSSTLQVLENAIVPVNNLIDLSQRLQGKDGIPITLPAPSTPYEVGAQQSFWVSNVDTDENTQISATLRYVTPHVYFWIEDGVYYSSKDLKNLAETFENKIYPTDREFFGSEWTPGVDGDPHLYILYAKGLGSSIAGYFSSTDEYTPQAHKYSNAHEMFMLSADNVELYEPFAYGVLAHEFQHMIHWYRDRNEETWMNEGFSDLAMFLNGYDVGGMDTVYVQDPDMQLTDWPDATGDSRPHYGASFLFLTYFLDRFGEEATKALVSEPSNGMVSIDQVLAARNAVDPETGNPITADDVFADWVDASYLQNGKIDDGRYTYHNYPKAPKPSSTERVFSCPTNTESRDVHQYGVDYIRITCSGDYTLHFEGSNQVNLLPADPHSGTFAFWSNQGDESDMTLTRKFDFSNTSGPLTLDYWTWYDIEKGYDYLYLEASTDGEHWQILKTPSGTSEDPSGNSYGWAYNGKSGGSSNAAWIQENVDLSQFAGEQVELRFEYITDAAVNGNGFLLDDVSVPQIGYSTDFETNNGGWQGDGFVRVQNTLPQDFQLSLITVGTTTTVSHYALSGSNTLDIPLHIGGKVKEAVLVVSGTTRFTRQKATYSYSITK